MDFPVPNYALVRSLGGLVLLLELLWLAPRARIYLGTDFHPGSPIRGRASLSLVLALWIGSALSLILGVFPLVGALLLLGLTRFFFIRVRFESLLRGAGAVGFMPYLFALYLVGWEISWRIDPSLALTRVLYTVFCFEFGLIMLCTGISKAASGYALGQGIELAASNPFWGRLHFLFRRFPPRHPVFKLQDYAAAFVQAGAGLLVLVPPLRPLGGLAVMGTFAYLQTVLRLAGLPALMVVIGLLFMPPLPVPAGLPGPEIGSGPGLPGWALGALTVALYAYAALYLAVKVVQYVNYYSGRALPGRFQRAVDALALRVPIFIWRVFTADLTNYFIRISEVDRTSGAERILTDENTYRTFARGHWRTRLRFLHVGESVAMSSVFNTLKYQQADDSAFQEKLLRYAASLAPLLDSRDSLLRFQFVRLLPKETELVYVPVSDFHVDVAAGRIEEVRLSEELDCGDLAPHSRIRPSREHGSYVPADAPG